MPIFDKLFYHSISVTNGINKTRYPGTLMPCSSLGEEDRDRQFLLNKNCPGVGLFSNSLFQMNRTINFDVLYL